MNLNHVNYEQYENISQYMNHPFGSMPREDNSLRIILFIQPDRLSSPSCFCAISMASRNDGSSLNWNAGLPRLDKFSFFCIDTSHTPDYDIYVSLHNTHFLIKEQGFKCAGTQIKPLTSNLIRDKTMAIHNYTKPTFIFVAVRRADVNSKPQRLRITANTELEARAILAKEFILVFAGRINPQNNRNSNRTLEVIYA
ncbi:host cell division inhibitor Icd-like protein [Aggregatibacter sp.]